MTYFAIDDHTTKGKKLVAFLKTQDYIEILEEPNTTTKRTIKDVEAGKVKKEKTPDDLFHQILGR